MESIGMFYAMMHETIESVESGKLQATEAFRFIREQMDDFITEMIRDPQKSNDAMIQLSFQEMAEAFTTGLLTAGHIELYLRKNRFTRNELIIMVSSLASIRYGRNAIDRLEHLKDLLR